MNADTIIFDNASGEENSFIGILHEQSKIDIEKFLVLFDAIVEVTKTSKTESAKAAAISKIQSYTLNAFVSHLDKNDLFTIVNFDENIGLSWMVL